MKRAEYAERGPVPQDVIRVVDFELPALGAGEVLVEVLAAPINPSDVLTLTGQYGLLPPLPAVGGNEGVGRVVEVGAGVKHFQPGQRVLLPIGGGTWRTHLVADARAFVPLPNAGDPAQLAMLAINPPTASLLLSEFVSLEPGEWVIQNAGNSAVGTYLIKLARLRGFNTVSVVRRESAVDAARQAGGDVVLVDGEHLSKRVAEATGAAAIRLGIDAVGGGATERLAQCLAPAGLLVNYGAMSGDACKLSPPSLIFRDISLRGFWLSRWLQQQSASRRAALFGELAALIADGTLSTPIAASFPLERIKEAIVAAVAGERGGKVVLLPNG